VIPGQINFQTNLKFIF